MLMHIRLIDKKKKKEIKKLEMLGSSFSAQGEGIIDGPHTFVFSHCNLHGRLFPVMRTTVPAPFLYYTEPARGGPSLWRLQKGIPLTGHELTRAPAGSPDKHLYTLYFAESVTLRSLGNNKEILAETLTGEKSYTQVCNATTILYSYFCNVSKFSSEWARRGWRDRRPQQLSFWLGVQCKLFEMGRLRVWQMTWLRGYA